MTTPPEAKLFHSRQDEATLRRISAAAKAKKSMAGAKKDPQGRAAKPAADSSELFASSTDDGFGDLSLFNTEKDIFSEMGPQSGAEAEDDAALLQEIEAVKAENHTPRKLRLAMRIAEMHEINATSAEEAVALLRRKGVDPFQRNLMRRAVAEQGAKSSSTPSPHAPSVMGSKNLPARRPEGQVPGPVRGKAALPTSSSLSEERRAAEIFRIQKDIAKRRRKKLLMLMARLCTFVFLPTIITGWYYFTQATPLYATYSQFQIQQASSGGAAAGGLGGLLGGTSLATNPDSVAVQSFLSSRDAMMRLDAEHGFKRAFQDPSIDMLTRLPEDATNEAAYGVYKSSVKISYDPTEGLINMEVIAPDPQLSRDFSLSLIGYAEEQVDQMTARLRGDQMDGAMQSYRDAEQGVQDALVHVQELQQQMGVLDPAAEGGVVMAQISRMEASLTQKRLELGTLQSNARPNQARVDALEGEIKRLEEQIVDTRQQLTESTGIKSSLAAITGQLRIAEGQLATRQQLLAASAGQLEGARVEANKQVRYLSLAVGPVAPDEATYPRSMQNTFIAFLIFSGIYLMVSLTASILREQVSS